MPEPAAGVMRMSADNDDQADQQHELADPGMAETGRSVLKETDSQTNTCLALETKSVPVAFAEIITVDQKDVDKLDFKASGPVLVL